MILKGSLAVSLVKLASIRIKESRTAAKTPDQAISLQPRKAKIIVLCVKLERLACWKLPSAVVSLALPESTPHLLEPEHVRSDLFSSFLLIPNADWTVPLGLHTWKVFIQEWGSCLPAVARL